MNKIDLDLEAQKKYHSLCGDYHRRLISRAYINTLERDGTTVQVGDLVYADNYLEGRSARSQMLVAVAGAIFGVGLAGLVQNLFDGALPRAFAYFVFLILGVALGLFALQRRP